MLTVDSQRGFTLLGLLFLIAGMGVAMAGLGTLWHTAAQREKEKELLFAGDQYRLAITSFWRASPKGQERLPKSFAELLSDARFPNKRHLRRLYPDPMTGSAEWGVVKGEDGGIVGVYSLSEAAPMKEANFPTQYAGFEGKPSYREWVFQINNGNGKGGGDNVEPSVSAPAIKNAIDPAGNVQPAQSASVNPDS
jgi:type II secretory pathway pseudopilin PulG